MINIKDDSRNIQPGDIFIALRGVSSDGHDYIEAAIKNGATKIIAEVGSYNVETLIVPDTREYLINYLKETYGATIASMRLIGITGTNGKTTSAFLIQQALNMLGEKTAYIGTIGFYIVDKIESLSNTTPDLIHMYNLLLKAHEQGCKNVVLELSSQGLSYKRVDGLTFDLAIFTNLTQDHLDFHKTLAQYAEAKRSLFKKLRLNAKAIINYDDAYCNFFSLPENTNLTYGFNGGDYQVTDCEMTNQKTIFTYTAHGVTYKTETSLLGRYNLSNILTVIAVTDQLGYRDISMLIPNLKTPKGRMDVIHYRSNSIIVDYAHTPDAVEKVIRAMQGVTAGNIYVVFGCTGDRDRIKRPIMADIVTSLAKMVIITNDDPHNEEPEHIVADMLEGLTNTNYLVDLDRKSAIIKGINLLEENDVLLILGKGHEEFMIIKEKRIPFNDYQTVIKYIK